MIQTQTGEDILLQVRHLRKYFPVMSGTVFRKRVADIKAVDDISFFIRRGETLGLVGESGSGKTTVARCILQLYEPTAGDVIFEGQMLGDLSAQGMRLVRRRMQIIFQDPYGSLNPRMTCGDIIGEPLTVHKLVDGKGEYRDRVAELLTVVGLNPYMADRYPHEFSGGQRQRIGLARALASDPAFIVIDMADGCRFAPRCRYAIDRCVQETPELMAVKGTHLSACWRAAELPGLKSTVTQKAGA